MTHRNYNRSMFIHRLMGRLVARKPDIKMSQFMKHLRRINDNTNKIRTT